ncbi:MAG: undecaprenyl-phosphate glucose phosphotransferase [Eubacteriales bacterium]|nr:undecaprenyl-phosphate glucose phosphotransferase [Eubacteriales bacterium]
MIRENKRFLAALNLLSDGLIVLCSYLFASWFWLERVTLESNPYAVSSLRAGAGLAACVYSLCAALLMTLFHVYSDRGVKSFRKEVMQLLGANSLGVLFITGILYLFRLQEFSRGVLFLFYVLSSLALTGKRVIVRRVTARRRRAGYDQKRVVLVGGGRLAAEYLASTRENDELGFRVVGYISPEKTALDAPHLGGMSRLEGALGPEIDNVVIALEPEESRLIYDALQSCEKAGTKVCVIPFYNDMIPSRPSIDEIGPMKLINLRTTPLDNLGWSTLKRLGDILFSLLAILVTSPIMLAAAIGIRCTSPGPILFRQKRIGRNKKPFTMLKFRSMRVNDEQDSAWTQNADSRKTSFGSFLRKTSIDELPQFFNVLKGDMSVVGPRPEIPHFVDQFRETIPLYMLKHLVRPGITGWAQVNGYRGDTSIVERIRCDLWYIDHWSIGLDLRIILRTIFGGMINRETLAKKNKSL